MTFNVFLYTTIYFGVFIYRKLYISVSNKTAIYFRMLDLKHIHIKWMLDLV